MRRTTTRRLLASVACSLLTAVAAHAADFGPRPLPPPPARRRWCRSSPGTASTSASMPATRFGPSKWTYTSPASRTGASMSTARWSAAPPAITCSSAAACSASRATSAGIFVRDRRVGLRRELRNRERLARHAARPARLRPRPLPSLRHWRRVVRQHRGHRASGGSFSKTAVGWTAGGGLEYAFLNNWSAKPEYLYADLAPRHAAQACSRGQSVRQHLTTQIVRGGLN